METSIDLVFTEILAEKAKCNNTALKQALHELKNIIKCLILIQQNHVKN